jgi:hypothetical protein
MWMYQLLQPMSQHKHGKHGNDAEKKGGYVDEESLCSLKKVPIMESNKYGRK